MTTAFEVLEILRPVIREEVAAAALREREFVLLELGKFLDRDPTIEDVRLWYEANLAIVEYVRDDPGV